MARTVARRAAAQTKYERLEARISPQQKQLFQRAAELQGRKLTDFVIASLNEAAQRTIEDMQLVRLGAADSRAFAEALLKPRKPSRRLQAAARRYAAAIG